MNHPVWQLRRLRAGADSRPAPAGLRISGSPVDPDYRPAHRLPEHRGRSTQWRSETRMTDYNVLIQAKLQRRSVQTRSVET